MKKLLGCYLFICIFVVDALAKVDFTQKELSYIRNYPVKVAVLPDFPPFTDYENGQLRGYSYDILQLISQKSGLKFTYEVDKWPANLKKFREKKVDIIDAISFRESRLAFTNYTKPYYEIPLVVFGRKDLNHFNGLESLKGMRLGITKNIFYKEQIKNLGIFELVEYNSFQDKLKALAFGEVDVIFGHLLSTQIAIKRSQYTNMKVLGELNLPTLKKTDLRLGVRKDNRVLYSIVKKSFDAITNEEWLRLYNKWISAHIDSEQSYTSPIVDLTEAQRNFLIKNKKLDCVITGSWPPFETYENGKPSGIAIDYWNLIKAKTLINSECRVVEKFSDILKLIKEKKADITLSTTITKDKINIGKFSKPYVSYPIAVATTIDKRYISETASLIGKKVAVGESYSAYQLLKNKYPQIDFVEVKSNFEAFRMLSKGEVYAVVDILPVLSYMIGHYGFNNLKISGITEFSFDVRMMVREDYAELIPIIDKGVNQISKKEMQEIKNKWLSVKYENIIDYSRFWQFGIVILIILIILFYRQYILNQHNKKLQEAKSEIEIKTEELEKKTLELAKQKELFEKIYYESSDGIFLFILKEKKVIDCNDVSFKLLGYDNKDEFKALKDVDFFPIYQPDGSESMAKIEKMFEVSLEKGSNTFELVHKKKDGTYLWLEVVSTPLIIDNQELIHIVWRDIDNRKKMEEKLNILTHKLEDKVEEEVRKNEEKTKQLIQQSRLAQMGEMISMIAHQWRQPLTAISATTNNLLIRMMIGKELDSKELENEINLISNYSQHLSMTIDDFRNFFKTDKEKTNTTLETIIDNSVSIMKSSLESHGVKLLLSYKSNKELNLYATEVSQVVLNLIKNAEDALIEKEIENPLIQIETYNKNESAIIKITDNANGISEKIIDKIFDPYFSTKKAKDGTGLGLYMSRIIINDHCKGELSVKNGKYGAIFKIEIPMEIKQEDS